MASYSPSMSSVDNPVVSGTIDQAPQISKTETPANTNPVRAPKLPESTLYIYGTIKVTSHVVNVWAIIPSDMDFARNR